MDALERNAGDQAAGGTLVTPHAVRAGRRLLASYAGYLRSWRGVVLMAAAGALAVATDIVPAATWVRAVFLGLGIALLGLLLAVPPSRVRPPGGRSSQNRVAESRTTCVVICDGSVDVVPPPVVPPSRDELVMCLAVDVQLTPAVRTMIQESWGELSIHQARHSCSTDVIVDLCRIVLGDRIVSSVWLNRIGPAEMTGEEHALAEQLAQVQLEDLEGPALLIPIEQFGQISDARRHQVAAASRGTLTHIVGLGPLADTGTPEDIASGFRVEGDVAAVAVVYPYGPATSALIGAARAMGIHTYELEASQPVDRIDESGAAPTAGPWSPGQPIEGARTARWSDLCRAASKSWRAVNLAETRRRLRSDHLVNRSALRTMANRHAGERCVIIGNGPSLNQLDLTLLAGEVTFAVNSIFLAADEMGFAPTYYMVEDNLVMRENVQEILAYEAGHKFFPVQYAGYFENAPDNVSFFDMDDQFYVRGSPVFAVPRFSPDFALRAYCGQSVTVLNLQLAYYLGFSEVVLVGMDFSYVIPDSAIREGSLITSTEEDPNHFHPGYFGAGKTWKDPKLDRVLASYQLAKRVYEADGRRIVNATAGGALELFPRADYFEVFGGPAPIE